MRAMPSIACIALCLTGCRFGFDELSGSGTPGDDGSDDVITTPPVPGVAKVIVIGEDGDANVGQPIVGAYVVAIEQDGATTTVRTGTDGTANIDIFGNTAIHVARPMDGTNVWALSSFRAINDGAQITVGGRPPRAMSSARTVTIDLPAFPMDYTEAWITGPMRCLQDTGYAPSTTVPLSYDPQCEGQTVELYAASYDIYVPIGSVTLTNGATIDRTTASWMDLDKVGMEYFNLPDDITDAGLFFSFPASNGDLIPIAENGDAPDMARYVGFAIDIPPVVPGTQLIHAFGSPTGVRLVYERIDSWPGNRMFDASMLAPPPMPATINQGQSQIEWTITPAPDADIYWSSTDITTGTTTLHWNAYGAPGAGQVTFPVLPSELAAIIPTGSSAWSAPRVVLAGLSDFDYATAAEIVDRDIYWWWSQGLYLPSGTLSLTATQSAP